MKDNITPFKSIEGGKEVLPMYDYEIVYRDNTGSIVETVRGYCMANSAIFCIVDELEAIIFMIPMSSLISVAATRVEQSIDPETLN